MGTGTDALRTSGTPDLVNPSLVNFSSCHFLKIFKLTGGSGWPSLIRAAAPARAVHVARIMMQTEGDPRTYIMIEPRAAAFRWFKGFNLGRESLGAWSRTGPGDAGGPTPVTPSRYAAGHGGRAQLTGRRFHCLITVIVDCNR